jgi:transcription elongation factor Elf1
VRYQTKRWPNWLVDGDTITFWCERCGRHLWRAIPIVAGQQSFVSCKNCGEQRLVVPDAAVEQAERNAA